jgi:pimeloyl-ACP methyl ester carboxylesterase
MHLTTMKRLFPALLMGAVFAIAQMKGQQTRPLESAASSIPAPIQYVQVDEVRIAYKVIGGGRPIIFFARFRGTLNDWDPAFVDAVAKSYQVILFDALGVGRSGGTVPTSVTKWAEQASHFVQALGIKRASFVGWSMGGAVAQVLAINYPEVVDKLVLLATGPAGNPDFVPGSQEFGTRARKPDYDFEDNQYLFFYKSEKAKAACEAYLERIALFEDKDTPVTTENYQNMSLAMADFKGNKERNYFEALKDIKIPVLIADGKYDPSYPLKNLYVLEKEIPNSKLIVYPDAGHGFQFQYARQFVPELLSFLDSD